VDTGGTGTEAQAESKKIEERREKILIWGFYQKSISVRKVVVSLPQLYKMPDKS
jgi:hypothetical protein